MSLQLLFGNFLFSTVDQGTTARRENPPTRHCSPGPAWLPDAKERHTAPPPKGRDVASPHQHPEDTGHGPVLCRGGLLPGTLKAPQHRTRRVKVQATTSCMQLPVTHYARVAVRKK